MRYFIVLIVVIVVFWLFVTLIDALDQEIK